MALLPDPPNFNDIYSTGRTEAIAKRPELSLLPGDVSDFLLAAGAAQADHLASYAQDRFKATYIDGAGGDDLTRLASDHLAIERFPASYATGVLHFHRDTDTAGSGTIVAGTQVATQPDYNGTSFTFTTDTDLTFGATQLEAFVNATAVASSSGSNVGTATITRLVSVLFDNTITVSNDNTFAGGTDAETDPDLRNRCRNFFATLRRGTLAALQYGAQQVDGVFAATAVNELDPSGALDYQGNPLKTGIVNVYIADQNGNSSPTMVDNVVTELELWRSAGDIVNVYGSQVVDLLTSLGYPLTVVVSLRVSSGLTAITIQDNIKAAVVARINRTSPGTNIVAQMLTQVVLNVDLDNIIGVSLKYGPPDPITGIPPYPYSTTGVSASQVVRTTTSEIQVVQA